MKTLFNSTEWVFKRYIFLKKILYKAWSKNLEKTIKAINEKYGIKKRWRAKRGGYFYYIDCFFEPEQSIEVFLEEDDDIYKSGNYFETTEEAEEYAEYIKKCSLEWHEKKRGGEW